MLLLLQHIESNVNEYQLLTTNVRTYLSEFSQCTLEVWQWQWLTYNNGQLWFKPPLFSKVTLISNNTFIILIDLCTVCVSTSPYNMNVRGVWLVLWFLFLPSKTCFCELSCIHYIKCYISEYNLTTKHKLNTLILTPPLVCMYNTIGTIAMPYMTSHCCPFLTLPYGANALK